MAPLVKSETNHSRVAFITGGRRGIGRASAYAMADDGFDIVINDIERDDDAEKTLRGIEERGRQAKFVLGDLADLTQHERIVSEAWSAFGPLTCLLNNAGVQTKHRGDMLETPPESFDRLMAVNVRAPFFLTQRIAKLMRDHDVGVRKYPQRSIIFISSTNAALATPAQAEYCVSKSGVSMMASLYALRLIEYGISVYEVRPGITQTDMTKDVFDKYTGWVESGVIPINRWGQPEDVGSAVAVLASGRIPYSTGLAIYIDGGMHIHRA